MDRKEYAEIIVLDRLMDLLAEGSVSRLVDEDHRFGVFISRLYGTIQTKAEQLGQEAGNHPLYE